MTELLLFEDKFDNPRDLKKILNRIFLYEDDINESIGSDIYFFYIELKEVLKNIKLTKNEEKTLSLWMMGYNSKQISQIMKKDWGNVKRLLRRVSEKVYGAIK